MRCSEHQDAEIHLRDSKEKTSRYMGSTEDGELDAEVTNMVQSGCKNWKRVDGCCATGKLTRRPMEGVQGSGVRGRDIEEDTVKESGDRRNEDVTMDVRS